MKYIICPVLFLVNAACFASYFNDNSNPDADAPQELETDDLEDELEPEVYTDVSKRAVNKAAAPNGVSVMAGIGSGNETYDGSWKNKNNHTKRDIKLFSGIAGVGYQKTSKSKFVLGADLFLNLAKKKKETGDWKSFNEEYDKDVNPGGTKTATLTTTAITPSMEARCGYLFNKFHATAFAGIGITCINGRYEYFQNTNKYSDIKVKGFVPTVCIGAEKKFSKKFGVRAEYVRPLKKKVTKLDHKIKVGKSDLRLLGVYNVGDL